MAAHKSFRTSERLALFAIFSRVCFSAANRDSARVGVARFGACFDALAAPLAWVSLYGDSGELFISIDRRVSQAHHARRLSRAQKCTDDYRYDRSLTPWIWMTMRVIGRIFRCFPETDPRTRLQEPTTYAGSRPFLNGRPPVVQ